MHVPARRVLAVFLMVLAGLMLLSISVVGAQSEAPPAVEKPAAGLPAVPPEPAAGDKDDNRVLTHNKSLKGKIQPANDVDNYYIFATAGQWITLNMVKTSGNLDGYMVLFDQVTNTTLAYDDDSGDGYNPRISNYQFQRSGRFRVILTSYNNGSTGNYNIVAQLSPHEANDNRLLAHNKTLSGNISPASDLDNYFFWADAGDLVTIQMWRNGGTLDTYLTLYDENGNYITSDDDGGNGTDSLISNVYLWDSGFYHVVAESYGNSSSGAYKIKRTTLN